MITNARTTDEAGAVVYRQENGVETIVDSDVAAWLPHVWLQALVRGVYVGFNRGRETHYLHRYIMKCPKGMVVDHINGNTKDNRRENLRVCSIAENVRHRVELNKNNSTGRRGVDYDAKRHMWVARIKHNRKNYSLGRFATFEEAKAARKQGELKYFGEFRGKV